MKRPSAPSAMRGKEVVYTGSFYADLIGKRVTVDMVTTRNDLGAPDNFICRYKGRHGEGGCTMDWADVEVIPDQLQLFS